MAPLIRLLVAFALSTAVLASPHVSRNVYGHAHRGLVPRHPVDVRADPLPLPPRKRSLNKRCLPRPSNATTTTPTPSSTPSTAPENVAPPPSSASPSSTPPTDDPSPNTPTPTPSPPTPTPISTPTPAQTSSSSGSSGSGGDSGLPSYLTQQQSGIATWYATGLGACGLTNSDTDYIAAISKDIFMVFPGYNQLDPNTNPVCNLQVSITSGGVTITVKITDECEGCDATHLDLSPAAFDALSNNNPGLGVINIDWQFVNLPSSLR